jgi:hypothetical protein
MQILPFLLQVIALVFLMFATFSMFPTSKVSWFPAGMLLWLLSLMVSGIALHPIVH